MRPLLYTAGVILAASFSFASGCYVVIHTNNVNRAKWVAAVQEGINRQDAGLDATDNRDVTTLDPEGGYGLYSMSVPGGCIYHNDVGLVFVEQKCTHIDDSTLAPKRGATIYGHEVIGGCIWHNTVGMTYSPYACSNGDSDDDAQ